jgi:hypothetical protein
MSNKKDFATSTVLVAPSTPTAGTSLVVQSGHGARFPVAPFYVTAHPPSEFPTLDNAEKLLVTAKDTDTFTITRAQGDTTSKSIEAGWRISNAVFLADFPATFDDLTDGTTNKAFTSTLKTKLDGIEALADVTDSTNVDAAGATMNTDTNVKSNSWVLDEDTMSSNLDTKVPTQQSVKAYIDEAITAAKSSLLPVGSIVVLGVSTNPNTLYGFGTWAAIAGRVIVGYDGTQTEFNAAGKTGGSKLLQAHAHIVPGIAGAGNAVWGVTGFSNPVNNSIATNSAGEGDSGNLQPYIVKYIWQRTA